jgi:hypothetical protein
LENFRPISIFNPNTKTTINCNEIDTSYQVEGLRPHEFPVVGLVVHTRIIPGFSYRVRPLNTSKYLFSGKALQLESIGQGYEKEITFKPDPGYRNANNNYFWSDSRPEGFGFEIEVVSPGMKFTMYDVGHKPIGTCEVIQNKEAQIEQSHLVWPDGTIEKWVLVKLYCKIESKQCAVSTGCISGIAIATKTSRSSTATLIRIMNCNIEGHNQGQLQHKLSPKQKGLTLMPGVSSNTRRITVCGTSVSDVPASYSISGLRKNEIPVIGTYVDSRVLPGFHYIVRPAHATKPLFNGESVKLRTIGRGYGKRFTFESASKNGNDQYFWSDSYVEGFGFAPHEVFPGMFFKIFAGEDELIGTALVKKADKPQEEIETVVLPNGGVLKRLRVEIICHLEVGTGVTRACRVSGTAVVIRISETGCAKVVRIESPGFDCQLHTTLRHFAGEIVFVYEGQKYIPNK